MNVEISVENDNWNDIDVDSITNECIAAVFSALHLSSDQIEICVLFTDNSEVRMLNKTFRGIDSATNVLSFPATPIEECCCDDDCEDEHDNILGSMAIAYETMQKEANEQCKTLEDHLRHLVVHSTLHLLGYDHIDESEAQAMESLEVKILEYLNVSNPYL